MDEKDYALAVLKSKASIDAEEIKKALPRWVRLSATDGTKFHFRLDHQRDLKHFILWLIRRWAWSGKYEFSFSGLTGKREPFDEWFEERTFTASEAKSEKPGFYESEEVVYDEDGGCRVAGRAWFMRFDLQEDADEEVEQVRTILVTPPAYPERVYANVGN